MRKHRYAALAFQISLLLPLILPAADGRCAEQDTEWVEIRTPHFKVLSDGSTELATAVGAELECAMGVLTPKLIDERKQPREPLYVIGFRSGSGMRKVAPLRNGEADALGGLFLDGESGRFIAVNLSARNLNHIVAHEFSHLLLSATRKPFPPWLQEGLAEIFAEAATGESERDQSDLLAMETPTTKLLALRWDSPEYKKAALHPGFYVHALLAAEYLWMDQERKKRLLAYLELTRAGTSIESAIKIAFQESGAELNRAVLEFASQRRKERSTAGASICKPVTSTLSPISKIDARARTAEFESQSADHQEDAIHEFETILSQSPGHEIALRGLAYALWRRGDVKQASKYFGLAADANPSDGKLRYLSAVVNTDGAHDQPEQRQKMRASLLKAISLEPESADAHHWLSLTYAWDGDYAAAVNSAKRALELDPENEQFRYNLAAFYAHSQRWSEARELCQKLRSADDKDVAMRTERLLNGIEHATPMRPDPALSLRLAFRFHEVTR